jgi:hypothetical protein
VDLNTDRCLIRWARPARHAPSSLRTCPRASITVCRGVRRKAPQLAPSTRCFCDSDRAPLSPAFEVSGLSLEQLGDSSSTGGGHTFDRRASTRKLRLPLGRKFIDETPEA